MYYSLLLLLVVQLSNALLLEETHKLPQYHSYGKSLVLVGGGVLDSQPEIFRQIVQHAGGHGVARIGVITASSSYPLESYQYYHDMLLKYGALKVSWIPISETNKSLNHDSEIVNLIRSQTGFMFSGGDQSRVISSFKLSNGHPSPALEAIEDQFNRGAVIAGTSAGTACQSANVMITGGMSWDALRYGSSVSSTHRDDLLYNPDGGLGFLHGYVLDTHFSERGREGRLIRLLADTFHTQKGTATGIGLDEKTALVISHAGTAEAYGKVVGPHGVAMFNVSRSVIDRTQKYFAIRDVYMNYLTSGDGIRLKDGEISFSPDKTSLKGHEFYNHALSSDDIFYGTRRDPSKKSEFIRVSTSLFDAKYDVKSAGQTHEKHPQFIVSLTRTDQDAQGYIKRGHNFQEDVISFKNLHISIDPK